MLCFVAEQSKMPYISRTARQRLDQTPDPRDAGELNYCLTMLLRRYLEQHGLSYATLNDALGALEGAKAEFYRRVAVPYEERKAAQNGDVYRALAEQAASGEAESDPS